MIGSLFGKWSIIQVAHLPVTAKFHTETNKALTDEEVNELVATGQQDKIRVSPFIIIDATHRTITGHPVNIKHMKEAMRKLAKS